KSFNKKIWAILAVMMIISTCFTSCSTSFVKEEPYQIEIPDYDEEEKSANALFNKTEDPSNGLYYYKPFEFESACMTIDVPSTWTVRAFGPTCIRISSPSDDPLLPEVGIILKCKLDRSTYSDEDESVIPASEYGKIFKQDIDLLRYSSDSSYSMFSGDTFAFGIKDAVIENTEIPDYCNVEDAASIVTSDIKKLDGGIDELQIDDGRMFRLDGFYNWNNHPTLISMIGYDDNLEFSKNILKYIMSSSTYLRPNLEPKTYEYGIYTNSYDPELFSMLLPDGFILPSTYTRTIQVDDESVKPIAGVGISLTDINDVLDDEEMKLKDITPEYIKDNYSEDAVARLMSYGWERYGHLKTDTIEVSEQKKLADEKLSFTSTQNLITDYPLSFDRPRDIYGFESETIIDYFIVERNEKTYMLSFMYLPYQKTAVKLMEKTAIETLKLYQEE
ncbi:MAG: hypothetical protein Q4B26_21150, partial [Eubacteriales bacterium]|nr:hypothetical protein [Eubacteriales bacterium]